MQKYSKFFLIVSITLFVIIVVFVLYVNLFLGRQINNKNTNIPIINNNLGIQIFSPKEHEVVSSPLKIAGAVNGNGWTGFEGQVGTVRLLDNSGKELALGILTATTNWMQLPTNFETTLFFDYPGDGSGQLVFYNENASGEPKRDKTYVVPVTLTKSSGATSKFKVYFNSNDDVTLDCEKVLPLERQVSKTEAIARVALEQLIKGPTDLEKNAGFITNINSGTKIQSLVIEDGVAKVDFNEELQKGVAGSCNVLAIRAQITETLKQFSTVKSVIISIHGKTEGILQP